MSGNYVAGAEYHIAGMVKIDGLPASRSVLVIADDASSRQVVAEGVSGEDGRFDITYFDWTGSVIALALDHFGDEWGPEKALSTGDVIHPSESNGYVYKVTIEGMTGTAEPIWSTEGSVQDGSVTYEVRPYYRPVASGPLQGEAMSDPNFHRLRFADDYTPPTGDNVVLRFTE